MKKSILINLICSLLTVTVLAVSVLLYLAFNGLLVVESKEIVIASSSSIATYDGTPLTNKDWRLVKGDLKKGHRLSVVVNGSQTTVGISENFVVAKVLNSEGVDVSKEYNIVYNPGSLNVKAREITINAQSAMKLYDQTPLLAETYTLSAQSSLVKGHELKVEVTGSQTEVGETASKIVSYEIRDNRGNNVTKNYNVKTNDGKLIVYKADTLIIETSNGQKYYDGEPLTKNNWYIKNGELLKDHNITVNVFGTITDVGEQDNEFDVAITDANGNDVTSYYTLVKSCGTLSVLPAPLEIITDTASKYYDGTPLTKPTYTIDNPEKVDLSEVQFVINIVGTITEIGTQKNTLSGYKFIRNGIDVTDFYAVKVTEGDLTILPPEELPKMDIIDIEISSDSDEKIFDGEPLKNSNWHITSGELYPNHTPSIDVTGTITNPGTAYNSFTVTILDEENQDVTEFYNITTVFGQLKVTKANVTVKSGSAQKIYDGFPLVENSFEVIPSYWQDNLTFNVEIIGSRTDVGISDNTIPSVTIENSQHEDVTNNFIIEKIEGTLEVVEVPEELKPVLVFSSGSSSKQYDKTPLTNSFCELKSGEYYPNDRAEIQLLSSITEIGKIANEITVNIYNENNDLVNDKYIIKLEPGTLEVTPIAITVVAGSSIKLYDGKVLTCNAYTTNPDNALISGHNLDVDIVGQIIDVGTVPNVITSVKVFDEDSNDVTKLYNITVEDGVLEILERNLPSIPTASIPTKNNGQTPSNEVIYLATATTSELAYLRMFAYGDYHGSSWGYEPVYTGSLSIDPLGLPFTALSNSNQINSIVIKKAMNDAYDVLPYFYDASSADYSNGVMSFNYVSNIDINYNNYTLPNEYKEMEEEYRAFVKQKYLSLPDSTKKAMLKVISENSLNKYSPTILSDVASLVQNQVKYDLNFDDYEEDIAKYFFNGATTGICSHYATAATALYRALDIPARYVSGIVGYVHKNVETKIRLPYHAWVEVYVDGFGWVPIEVTGSDENGGIGGLPNGGKPTKIQLTVKPQDVIYDYDGTPVSSDSVTIDGLDTDEFSYNVSISGNGTNVGNYKTTIDSFTLYDKHGNDITDNYEIEFEEGNITINERNITVETGSKEKDYDGTPLTYKHITVSSNSENQLLDGHYIVCIITGTQTEPGSSENTVENFDIIDQATNQSVLSNYNVTIVLGNLTINSATNYFIINSSVGTTLYLRKQSFGDYNGKDFDVAPEYTQNYDNVSPYYFISYGLNNSGLSNNVIRISPQTNYIFALPYYSLGDAVLGLYDTTVNRNNTLPYTVNFFNWNGQEGANLISAHIDAEANYYSFVKDNYLKIDNETYNFLQTIITNNNFNASNSNIINTVANYIKNCAYFDLSYDSNLDNENNVVTAFLSNRYNKGTAHHFAAAATMLYRALGIPARYTVGFMKDVAPYTDTVVSSTDSHAWVEVYVKGMGWINIEVTGELHPEKKNYNLTVKPEDVARIFNNNPLTANNVSISGGFSELEKIGYHYTYSIEGTSTSLGKTTTRITSFIIYNNNDEPVYDLVKGITNNKIKVAYKTGTIHQYLSQLTFTSGNATKTYDGEALTIEESQISLVGGAIDSADYTYEITEIASIIDAGQTSSSFKIVIYKNGVDCTDHYKLVYNYGKLTINVRDITLTAKSDSKVYDGTALTNSNIEYSQSDLATGDYIDNYIINGSQTNIGVSANVIDVTSIIIRNKNGKNVTSNYRIKTVDGQLKVTK